MNEILKNIDPFHADILIGCALCFGISLLGFVVCVGALVLNYFENRKS